MLTNSSSKILKFFFTIFSIIGFVFVVVFFAQRSGLLNVKGSISERNSYFVGSIYHAVKDDDISMKNLCQIEVLNVYAPATSVSIYKSLNSGASDKLVESMINSASNRFAKDPNFIDEMYDCYTKNINKSELPNSAYEWADTNEWGVMKYSFTRDQAIIKQAATDSGISARILLGGIIGEQFRFFGNRRETFKQYFEPMKILASLSDISYGIAGIKPKTAKQIEDNLKDLNSPYYIGPEYEHILDYPEGVDIESERMKRITNAKDPYYSYLYVGLYMKQIQTQWQKEGYNITTRPDVLATLYNLGFYYSKPKAEPLSGGAVINVNNKDYNFGDLAYQFYYSGELAELFPLDVVE